MKHFLTIFLAATLTLSLAACDKADNNLGSSVKSGVESSSSASSESTGTTSTEQSAPESADNTSNASFGDKQLTLLLDGQHLLGKSGCSTDEGYYSIQSNVAGGGFDCITYVDYATKQEVILCSDSSCKHDTERCTSVLTDEKFLCELFFYKEHLYYLVTDFDNEGVWSAGSISPGDGYSNDTMYITTPRLYRMNPDGTNRELVYMFGDNERVEHFAVGDGDCIWFVKKEPTIERDEETGVIRYGSKNRAAVRLDLNERELVEQIPISYKDNIDKEFIGVCGGKMIFGGIAYPDGKSAFDYIDILAPSPTFGDTTGLDEYYELMSRCEYVFFALDVTDKTMREIYRTGFDRSILGLTQIGDKLYIPTKDNSAFTLDLNTGGTEEFYVPEGYELDGFVGERPVFITTDGEYKRYFSDPDTGEMKNWILGRGGNEVIAVNSGSALVVYKTVGEEQPDGGIMNPVDMYALISLDDLYNGRENFEPVDMLKRSK